MSNNKNMEEKGNNESNPQQRKKSPRKGHKDPNTDNNEDSICKRCMKDVREGQDGIACDLCISWFHIGCVHITRDEYNASKKFTACKWFCKECDCQLKNMETVIREQKIKIIRMEVDHKTYLEKFEEFQSKLDSLNKTIVDLREQNKREITKSNGIGENFAERLGRLESKVQQIEITNKEKISDETTKKVLENVKEREDRQKKERNLILFNVPEPKKQLNENQKIREDIKRCDILFKREMRFYNVEIEEITRMGRESDERNGIRNKPRPLLVKLREAKNKWRIIANAKWLRESSFEGIRKVSIAPDMTKKEREENKKLREEVSLRRENGENIKIHRGKIITLDNYIDNEH